MIVDLQKDLQNAKVEMKNTLCQKIIPFWLSKSIDSQYGGYLTAFDENGNPLNCDEKYIVTQSRMVWGFSFLQRFAEEKDREKMKKAAEQGARFLIDAFWDKKYGGFYWKLNRDGKVLDPSKLTYGESFAIYALSIYALVYADDEALEYAEKTFACLQLYAADTQRGGYFENIEENWEISPGGAWAGDRKSLDIHMHLMEAFTALYQASGKEIHKRKLQEVIGLILQYMVNLEKGYGYNQFDLSFHQIPAINIMRTWNAERETNETVAVPTDTTSYGHNVELSWLLDHAQKTLGAVHWDGEVILRRLLDHALRFGYDAEFGGVYRDGIADREVLVTDKEWWQNFESLVGFLNGYVKYGEEKYAEAFLQTWVFVRDKFMNMPVGESRQLLTRTGDTLVGNMGNPWKGIYHTGRALAECLDRFSALGL